MTRRPAGSSVSALLVATAAVAALVGTVPAAQAPPAPTRILGHPNLNGIWQAVNEANWDLEPHGPRPGPEQFGATFADPGGLGVVDGGTIPYKPEFLAKKRENFEHRWERDPEARCYMAGVPRATYQPFPFQIVQGTDRILVSYPFASASRIIHMKDVGESPADSWMGWSRGRWEGDTLVVDTVALREDTLLDLFSPHSDELSIRERIRFTSPGILEDRITATDPKALTEPFTQVRTYRKASPPNDELREFSCAEGLLSVK